MRLKHKSTSNRLSKLFKIESKKNDPVPPVPQLPPPADGDVPANRTKNQLATKEELRDLRELIRYRYALDVEIWNLRDVQEYNRDVVREKMKKSAAALQKIIRIVHSLDDRSYFSSEAEHAKLKEIKMRIMLDGKRNWDQHPPWEDDEQAAAQPFRYEYDQQQATYAVVKPYELDSDSGHGTVSFISSRS